MTIFSSLPVSTKEQICRRKTGSIPSLGRGKSSFLTKLSSSGNNLRAESDHIPQPTITPRSRYSCPSPIFIPTGQPGTPAPFCPPWPCHRLSQTQTRYHLGSAETSSTRQPMYSLSSPRRATLCAAAWERPETARSRDGEIREDSARHRHVFIGSTLLPGPRLGSPVKLQKRIRRERDFED